MTATVLNTSLSTITVRVAPDSTCTPTCLAGIAWFATVGKFPNDANLHHHLCESAVLKLGGEIMGTTKHDLANQVVQAITGVDRRASSVTWFPDHSYLIGWVERVEQRLPCPEAGMLRTKITWVHHTALYWPAMGSIAAGCLQLA